jgi:hypothetical protein
MRPLDQPTEIAGLAKTSALEDFTARYGGTGATTGTR